jgi:ketosteroid isomerase-like protein
VRQRPAKNQVLVAAYAVIVLFASLARRRVHSVTMTLEQNLQTADRTTRMIINHFNEAVNRHEADTLASMLTEDTAFENTSPAPDGKRIEGTAVLAFWREWFASHPDARFETEEMIVGGDRAVVRWVYRKMRKRQPWHLRGVDVFTVRDGKVAEKLAYVKG